MDTLIKLPAEKVVNKLVVTYPARELLLWIRDRHQGPLMMSSLGLLRDYLDLVRAASCWVAIETPILK